MKLTRLLLPAFAIVALFAPQTASAGTEFGDSLTGGLGLPGSRYAMVQILNADGTDFNGAPSAGVLTSLTVRSNGAAGNVVASFLRPAGPVGATFSVVKTAPDQPIAVTADATAEGHTTTVPTRVSVLAGDRVGLTAGGDGIKAFLGYTQLSPPAPQNMCAYFGGDNTAAVGVPTDFLVTSCNYNSPAVRATLEADADLDGYGDESQDQCSTDAATQGPCPARIAVTAVKSKSKAGQSATRSFTIRNTGGLAASGVKFTIKASKKVRNLKIVSGCKPGRIKTKCTIATIAPGASVTIKVRANIRSATRTTLTATADGASATTTVKFKQKKK